MNLFRKDGRRHWRLPAVAFAGTLFAFQAISLLGAQSASAAESCSFSGGVVTVTLPAAADSATFTQGASGEVDVNGSQCSSATVSNTTTIDVTGSAGNQSVSIDLSTGDWGAINWAINLGSGIGDSLDVTNATNATSVELDWGANGIDLNGDGNLDVTQTSVETFTAEAGSGGDVINAGGGGAVGAAFPQAITITGGAGDDTVSGGSGDDILVGGVGTDTVDYSAFSGGVQVNLTTGTATGAGSDTLATFENIVGGSGNDTLTGDGSANTFTPGAGNDRIHGAGGTDTLDLSGSPNPVTVDSAAGTTTGDGSDRFNNIEDIVGSSASTDTLDFSGETAAVTVDLGAGTISGSSSGLTTESGFENVMGSPQDDTITGDGGPNNLSGAAGNDTITGAAGNDTVIGGPGNDTITGGTGNDTVIGGFGDDMITGGTGNDLIKPGAGTDSVIGGGGFDTVSYAGATAKVSIDLSLGTVSSSEGDDTLSAIGGAVGSPFADTINGDGSNNLLVGGLGNDTIRGGLGDDTVNGGKGDDTLIGGSGDDLIRGGPGNDDLFGGIGTDIGFGGSGSDTCTSIEVEHSC
jgi:Ca2+-binding RTX toxin-like protein